MSHDWFKYRDHKPDPANGSILVGLANDYDPMYLYWAGDELGWMHHGGGPSFEFSDSDNDWLWMPIPKPPKEST
jgi:hypothetical protein